MANPDHPSGGISTRDMREDSDKYYRTMKWVPDLVSQGPPLVAGNHIIGSVPISCTGTVEQVRFKIGSAIATNWAAGGVSLDVHRAAAGTALGAGATITTAAIEFALDRNNTPNTWVNATLTAAGTRVAAGDLLYVVCVNNAVPLTGTGGEAEVIIRPDF